MESSDPSANYSEQRPDKWAEVLGTLIALTTLILPVAAIAHFSANPVELFPPATYPITRSPK